MIYSFFTPFLQLKKERFDGLFGSDLFLRHSSPPQRATDFILRPPLSSLCDYFACCSLPLRYADFLQNFCSAEICTTSLHQQGRDLFVHSLFNIFYRETTFLCYAKNSLLCFRPFPEVTLLERPRWRGAVMSLKKEKRNKEQGIIFGLFWSIAS